MKDLWQRMGNYGDKSTDFKRIQMLQRIWKKERNIKECRQVERKLRIGNRKFSRPPRCSQFHQPTFKWSGEPSPPQTLCHVMWKEVKYTNWTNTIQYNLSTVDQFWQWQGPQCRGLTDQNSNENIKTTVSLQRHQIFDWYHFLNRTSSECDVETRFWFPSIFWESTASSFQNLRRYMKWVFEYSRSREAKNLD